MTERATSFGAAAATYEAGRPTYPEPAVAWLLGDPSPDAPPLRVADVGAGTGKLTRGIVATGAEVVAVDPDPAMLAVLREQVPGVPTFRGTAEALPLPDGSVDAVVMGQAWHWVEPGAASREVARVLRPGGVLGLIWNVRDESEPWVRRLTEIMHGSRAEQMVAAGAPPVAPPLSSRLDRAEWRWTQTVTRADLLAMARSRSYLITAGDEERARIERGLADLLDEVFRAAPGFDTETRTASGADTVELPYVTTAFRAHVSEEPTDGVPPA
ncbi:class I SAM-dependent methyltransferase [Miniimonas sp. S16]|nr:class I SAM-dependent methyltransferase [Miniimonas sp. S16]